jgi:uncharacterized membrane protein YbhN (UPF0104 family)
MHLSMLAAQLICAALVAADQLTKTWRIQILARGLGYRPGFYRIFAFNVASDASASLTPMRIGGEPVRFAGIMHCGLPVSDTIALMSVEGTMEYVSVILVAAYIGSMYGSQWWVTTRSRLVPAAHHALPWIALTVVVGFALLALLRRAAPRLMTHVHGTLRDSLRNARRIAPWAVAASVPLTLIHVLARVAILPALILTVPTPPPLGAVWFGSVALLYGQLFVPTPAGAGAVDLGFLNGAAGYVGANTAQLLVIWRFYTTVTGIILGVIFGVPYYSDAARRWLLRRRARRGTLQNGPSL